MISWLVLEDSPLRQYYSDALALELLDASHERSATLKSLGTLTEDTQGETANLSAVIDIAAIAHFDDPPIGAASVQADRGEQYRGTIKSITVAAGGITVGIDQ